MAKTQAERLRALCDRNGWTCHLCHRAIPEDAELNSPMAASRDHVIPRALAPGGIPHNTLPAHRWCNSKRMARPVDDLNPDALYRGLVRAMNQHWANAMLSVDPETAGALSPVGR